MEWRGRAGDSTAGDGVGGCGEGLADGVVIAAMVTVTA